MVLHNGDPEYLEDDDDDEQEQKETKDDTPNKKKKKYPQKYRRAWEQNRSWLTEQEGLAYCRACDKQLGNNITRLIRHEQTTKHKRREQQVKFEAGTVSIESIKSEQATKSPLSEKISYYSADEQDDDSSEADNLLKPVITKVEVVKEDKIPIRKKKRDTITPSSFRYKVDDFGEDEFDVIGKNVANKLRKLAPDTQMYAEKLVMDVIFQAQIGNIFKNSVLQIINCESQQPSSQPSSSVQSDCQVSVNIAPLPNSTPKNVANFE